MPWRNIGGKHTWSRATYIRQILRSGYHVRCGPRNALKALQSTQVSGPRTEPRFSPHQWETLEPLTRCKKTRWQIQNIYNPVSLCLTIYMYVFKLTKVSARNSISASQNMSRIHPQSAVWTIQRSTTTSHLFAHSALSSSKLYVPC